MHRPLADINRDWRGASEYMSGHYAHELIQALCIVMVECCDAIRDQDDLGALRMLEVALISLNRQRG